MDKLNDRDHDCRVRHWNSTNKLEMDFLEREEGFTNSLVRAEMNVWPGWLVAAVALYERYPDQFCRQNNAGFINSQVIFVRIGLIIIISSKAGKEIGVSASS